MLKLSAPSVEPKQDSAALLARQDEAAKSLNTKDLTENIPDDKERLFITECAGSYVSFMSISLWFHRRSAVA